MNDDSSVPGMPFRLLAAPGRTLVKAVFVQDENVYLPRVIDKVLREFADSTVLVAIMSSAQGGRSVAQTALDLWRLYGSAYFFRKAGQVAMRRVADRVLPRWGGYSTRTLSIARVCAYHGVRALHVSDVNAPVFLDELTAAGVECVMSVSGTQLYRKELRSRVPYGILNCHGALLPRYRGLMPSFWTLANGEREGGVSVHFVDAKLDNGPVVAAGRYRILSHDRLEDVMRRSKDLAAELIIEALRKLDSGGVTLLPNDAADASSFSFPSVEDRRRLIGLGHRLD